MRRVPWLRSFLLWPIWTRPGYWFATGAIFVYGRRCSAGDSRAKNGMRYFRGMPTWSFGRGGTTIGAIYLTKDNDSDNVIEHEAEHRAQWKRYGLAFIFLYIAAGIDARRRTASRSAPGSNSAATRASGGREAGRAPERLERS